MAVIILLQLEFAELDDKFLSQKEPPQLDPIDGRFYEVGLNCLRCLDKLYNSKAVRVALYKLGFVKLLKKLIISPNQEFYKMGIRMITRSASCVSIYRILPLVVYYNCLLFDTIWTAYACALKQGDLQIYLNLHTLFSQ